MKYYSVNVDYPQLLLCHKNMRDALVRLGELDPYSVKRHTLKNKGKKNIKIISEENKNFKRGILNVRRALNCSLKQSAKYSNKMISRIATARYLEENNIYYFTFVFPGKSFVKIIKTTYDLLYKHDPSCCKELLEQAVWGWHFEKFTEVARTLVPLHIYALQRSKMNTNVPAAEEAKRFILQEFTRN